MSSQQQRMQGPLCNQGLRERVPLARRFGILRLQHENPDNNVDNNVDNPITRHGSLTAAIALP